jgi:Mg-chelatase subunit ChlI
VSGDGAAARARRVLGEVISLSSVRGESQTRSGRRDHQHDPLYAHLAPPFPAPSLRIGAAASDDDADVGRTADKLAEVDLSTPLREDELLPKAEHRRVNDAPAAGITGGGKGRGRARNLHAAVAGSDAEENGGKKASKKSKKDKDEKEEKKSSKSKDKVAGKDEKDGA